MVSWAWGISELLDNLWRDLEAFDALIHNIWLKWIHEEVRGFVSLNACLHILAS